MFTDIMREEGHYETIEYYRKLFQDREIKNN